jgi:RNA polymerase sigma-70 factor (family 1)
MEIQLHEDSILLNRAGEGDRRAFDLLYERYWKHVYNAAYKRLQSHDHAKDIAQDVFTQLWVYLNGSPAVIENLPGYLYNAVRNNVLKVIEKERRFVGIPDLLDNLERTRDHADTSILYAELEVAYQNVLETMPAQQRTIFQMRYVDELSSDAIAGQLDISPKTVRNQLGRALVKIKAALFVKILFSAFGM